MSDSVQVHAPGKVIDVYINNDNLCIRMSGINKKMYRAKISNGDSAYALVNSLRDLADSIVDADFK